jgi:hypothetical protein
MYPWTVFFHPKYRSVTWILIFNIFLFGMNGSFSYKAVLKLLVNLIKDNNQNDNFEIVILAGVLELIKYIAMQGVS